MVRLKYSKLVLNFLSGHWDKKAVLLCQSCVLHHAVENPSLGYEVCRSIKLCYLSLVQHQHSGKREEIIIY